MTVCLEIQRPDLSIFHLTFGLQFFVSAQKLTRLIGISETTASRMISMEQQICTDVAKSQRHIYELVTRQQDTLSESVKHVADQLAALSVEHKSQLVSTRFDPLNDSISSHTDTTGLSEEIAWIKSRISNPIVRNAFGAAVNSAFESHLEMVPNEQETSQQARCSTRSEPGWTRPDVADPSSVLHNNDDRSRSKPASPKLKKRARLRSLAHRKRSVKDFFGGRIYIQTDTYKITTALSSGSDALHSHGALEHQTHFIYHPAPWFLRICFNFGMSALITKAAQGWQYHIRTIRAVPNDSLIFEFCKSGNLDGVRSLLKRGDASPWDTNSYGWNPLHVSRLFSYPCSSSLHLNFSLQW